jgi:undecaprenyl diphosphate synthase
MLNEATNLSINHLGVIMDGNSRWAEQNNLSKHLGHKQGALTAKSLIEIATKYKIKHLSLFAFSTENWQRPAFEVTYLLSLFEDYLTKEFQALIDNKIQLLVVGDLSKLPESLKRKIQELNNYKTLNPVLSVYLMFSYGAKQEIIKAIKCIIDDVKSSSETLNIDEESLKKYLYAPKMPDLDMVIRTGGDKRISNFLLWHIAYAELYFMDKYWPDFNEQDLISALTEYTKRTRTFGRR